MEPVFADTLQLGDELIAADSIDADKKNEVKDDRNVLQSRWDELSAKLSDEEARCVVSLPGNNLGADESYNRKSMKGIRYPPPVVYWPHVSAVLQVQQYFPKNKNTNALVCLLPCQPRRCVECNAQQRAADSAVAREVRRGAGLGGRQAAQPAGAARLPRVLVWRHEKAAKCHRGASTVDGVHVLLCRE